MLYAAPPIHKLLFGMFIVAHEHYNKHYNPPPPPFGEGGSATKSLCCLVFCAVWQ